MHLRMGQVPEFIGVKNLVSLVHSLLDFRSAPCALQGSYVPATISHHGIVKYRKIPKISPSMYKPLQI